MAKKKPISIGEITGITGTGGKPSPSFSAMLAVAVLLFAALGGLWLLQSSGALPSPEGKIEIILDGKAPLFENDTAKAVAFSSCGEFSLFLDGQPIASGSNRAQSDISLRQGSHTLEAKNADCFSLLNFIVRVKECEGRQQQGCTLNGCAGTRTCNNGAYTGCVLPRKTCVPGRSIGCSSDSCKFGYMTCNSCGTGYGPCTPPGGQAAKAPACTGANCN